MVAGALVSMIPACGAAGPSKGGALQSIPIAGDASYEIAILECSESGCPIEVRLVRAEETIARASLDWPASTREVYPSEITRELGIGDPFDPPRAEALVAGEESNAVAVLGRPVRLTPELTALLVDQAVGFDHVTRRHYVFVARDGALERIWTGREGQGPTYTATAIRAVAADRDEVLYFDQLSLASGATFDELTVSALAWDAGSRALQQEPARGLHAVVLGPYPDASAARQEPLCLAGFLVLPADRLLTVGGAALAAITGSESAASATRESLASCTDRLAAQIVEVP